MKIYCAQINQVWEDADSTFEKAEAIASESDADIILFCEQSAVGWRATPSFFSGDEIKERWLSLARKYNKCIIGSYQKKTDSEKPENTMLVCSPNGKTLAEYSKTHLFSPADEDKYFSAGNKPVTFEYKGIKFGCSICFDLRFPELFREYLHSGCQIVLVQAAWAAARVSDWELLLRARALENRNYVVACGCLGYDPVSGTDYSGRSLICDFEGRILSDAGVFEGGAEFEMDSDEIVSGVTEMRKKWGL